MGSAQEPPGPRPSRPPRSDAYRNRAAILDAAAALTATAGATVSVQDVAQRAGVAVGTVYRHWPTKQDLLGEVLLRRLDEVAASAEAAESLSAFVDAVTDLCVRDRPLLDLLDQARAGSLPGLPDTGLSVRAEGAAVSHAPVQDRFDAALARLITRARDADQLRNDVTPRDLRIYLVGLRAALSSDDLQAWSRHHAIFRDGLFRSGI